MMRSSRRRNPFGSLFMLIFLGVFGGIAFLVFNGMGGSDDAVPSPAAAAPTAPPIQPTAESVAQLQPPSATPFPTPTLAPGTFDLNDAQLIIPAVAINSPIVQVYIRDNSWDVNTLGLNVGHLQGTTWLTGVTGNIVLSGHVEMRDGRRGVFANLDQLEPGALIILRQGGVEQRYMVTEINAVDPSNLDPVRPTEGGRLTLITCDDYDFFRDAYTNRVVVVAEPIG